MRITADTNLLARALLRDDPEQTPIAEALLSTADLVAVPAPVLCELVWLLTRRYRRPGPKVEMDVRAITESAALVTDRSALDAGLRFLRSGGDFADGAIAFQGRDLGGRVFASFDREAVRILRGMGQEAADPGELVSMD